MKKMALAGLLLAAMGGASAQVYVGGALGLTHVDCPANVANCDAADMGFKASVGYRLNRVAALEASYIDFGKSKFNVPILAFVGGSQEVSGFVLNAALRHDLTRELTGVGRLGFAMMDTKLRAGGASRTESSTKVYFGLGLEYALSRNLKATAAADFTSAEYNGDSHAVRMFSAGAQYEF